MTGTRLLSDVQVGELLPELTVEVTATTVVLGALATRDWRPQHHDYHFATERNGVRDIFLSAPNQAAWFERYLTDWSGPGGRPGRLALRLRESVFPGDLMALTGHVAAVRTDATGCGWVELELALRAGARPASSCQARLALPVGAGDNPWARRGERWTP